jgi:drug/metabolite transporter (DMT)-like permease
MIHGGTISINPMFSNFFTPFNHLAYTRPQLAAIGYILISTTGFSLMSAGVRLISPELHASVIVTLRNVLTLVLLLPWVLYHGRSALRSTRIVTHAWRGIIGGVGMLTWTYALTIMPLAHATALSFTAPLFVTLFAIFFLKEAAGFARWMALIVGFSGTLVIIRPSIDGFDANALIVIFATASWAITSIFVKSLSSTEPPLRMVFYMNFFMLIVSLPFGIIHWQMPSAHAWAILAGMGFFSLIMHFSMARAYALAPISTLMPFDFTRLIMTAILAYFLFGETSDSWTWLGASLIIASAVFSARRDAKTPPLA